MPAPKGNDYASSYDEGKHPDQIRKMCERGLTNDEIADVLDVDRSTLYRWAANHQKVCDSLKVGKAVSDNRVERSLYERAMGYTHEEDKIFQHNGEAVVVPTVKHYPPDTTAAIFWLKNRRPEQWRDKQEIEHTGEGLAEAMMAAQQRLNGKSD